METGTSCPYKPRSMIWALYNEDFSDLTIAEISEVFNTTTFSVKSTMKRIFRETGKRVQHKGMR